MKKIISSLILSFVCFLTASSILAAPTLQKAKPAMQWHCLQTTYCGKAGANCANGQSEVEGTSVVPGHRTKLNTKAGDLPAKNTQTTPYVCVATNQGNICTSGDDEWDLLTVGYRGLSRLKQIEKYEFQGLYSNGGTKKISPRDIYANEQGKLAVIQKQAKGFELIPQVLAVASQGNKYKLVEPLEMQDYTPAGRRRKWVALNLIEPAKIEMGQGGEQQGTFTFEGAIARCATLAWDPYGVVFDSQSLEPVMGTTVSLLKKSENGQYALVEGEDAISLPNPVRTLEDGAFEFFVPDGTYKLNLTSPNFTFPNKTKLNPNYSKIYSEIYRGEDIVESGKTEHRDIPIDSKGIPYRSEVKLLEYFPMLDKATNSFVVEGRVSHPLTIIKVYGKKASGSGFERTRLLITYTADKLGNFKIDYNMNKLPVTEIVGDIEFIKPDYSDLKTQVTAAPVKKNTVLSIEPIPNYLEGYAYDKNGQPLANATVGVYLNSSNKSAYETVADEKGFYKISSEYLPAMSYEVRYEGTGLSSPVAVKTSEFIAQNAKYLTEQGANLFAFKNKKGQVFAASEREPFTNPQGIPTNIPVQAVNQQQVRPKNTTQSNLVPVILILVILGVAGMGTIMYFMKKK